MLSLFSQDISFRHLTVGDGLSQNTINCIFQDSRGFIWFGTQDGLNCYDGYSFSILRGEPADSNSLSHSWVWDVFEDSRKNIWVATWNGLNRYDPVAKRFIHYLPDPKDSLSLSGSRPTSICEDADGFLWIGTWGGGLNRYDYNTDRFVSFMVNPDDNNTLASNFIRKVYYTSKREIWAGTWDGLTCIKKSTDGRYQFTNYRNNPANTRSISANKITSIINDKQGRLWVGTLGGGLNRFDEKNNQFIHYRHSESNPQSLSGDDVSVLFEDSKGQLWVGVIGGGVNKFNRNNESFLRISHDPENKYSLNGDNVYCIYEDKSGLLWIGANGLNIYNSRKNHFHYFHSNSRKTNSLSHNKVTSFYEDQDGIIWIGTDGGGLNRYDRETDRFTHFKSTDANPQTLSSNNVSSLTGGKQNEIWVGTRGGGVYRFNSQTGKFYPLNLYQPSSSGGILNYVNALKMDHSGSLWIATYESGLVRYDIPSMQYDQFINDPEDPSSLSGNYLLTIYVDSENDIWLGIWGGGLCRYNRENKAFTSYTRQANDPSSLGDNIVHSIHESSAGGKRVLWIGTSSGLSFADISKPGPLKFDHISQQDGLPSNVIYSILEDQSGNLWLSTNMGISCFNPDRRTFKNYDIKDGLQSNEFNTGSGLVTRDGLFLFGGINGFNTFSPDSIFQSLFLPDINLTSFKIFDKSVLSGMALFTTSKIKLDYKQNFFSFEFSALDFSQPDKNQYAYRLEGFDQDWIYSGSRRYASYTNLDPGGYTFRVIGSNSDGVWNENGASVQILIKPPFWHTWWFRFLSILIISGILYQLYKYRVSKLLEIERMRIRIASDLHDDIGSTLTKIAIHSEVIRSTDNKNKIVESSQKIGRMSREIISSMSDIVWSIDARNDTLRNLIDRMRDFSSTSFAEKNIKLSFKNTLSNEHKKIPVHFRQNIFLIFKEAIHNILKHTDATEVCIDFSGTGNKFRLCISDNGEGIDENNSGNGNGIKNMKLRADRIHSVIDINNNNGTEVCLYGKLP